MQRDPKEIQNLYFIQLQLTLIITLKCKKLIYSQ